MPEKEFEALVKQILAKPGDWDEFDTTGITSTLEGLTGAEIANIVSDKSPILAEWNRVGYIILRAIGQSHGDDNWEQNGVRTWAWWLFQVKGNSDRNDGPKHII